jgi:hypothetical protein
VYVVDADRPGTEIGDDAPVPVRPPGFETAVYPVIAEPLLSVDAVNATLAVLPATVAVPMVGADGTDPVWKYGPLLAVLVPMALVAVNATE